MKDNKLLAEYVGYIYTKFKGLRDCVRDKDGTWIDWNPDSDWNDLMMVVEKILKELSEVIDWKERDQKEEDFKARLGTAKIDWIYNACIEYIKSKKRKEVYYGKI